MPGRMIDGGLGRGRVTRAVLVALGLGVLGGAVAGVAWEALWTPPSGVFFEGGFYLDERGLTDHFAGTGWFVLVGVVTGLLLGGLAALAWRSAWVLALVVSAVSSVVATVVMTIVGTRLGPEPPATFAARRDDYTPGVLDLHVAAWPAYAAVVVGAMAALLLGLGLTRLGSATGHDPDRPADMIAS